MIKTSGLSSRLSPFLIMGFFCPGGWKMEKKEITITNINIPFWKLVTLLVNVSITAIQAGIIVTIFYVINGSLIGSMLL